MRFRYDPPVICPLTDGQQYSSGTAVEGGVVALGGEIRQAFVDRPRGRVESRVNYRCM